MKTKIMMEMAVFFISVTIVIGSVVVVLLSVSGIPQIKNRDWKQIIEVIVNPSCDSFKNQTIGNIPVRCLKELDIKI